VITGPELRGILAHSRKSLRRLVLVVKLREVPAVLAGNRGPEAGGVVHALLESRDALQHVPGPADGLPKFAVTDDVDTDRGLLLDHLGDGAPKAFLIGSRIVWLAVLLCLEKRDELERTNETSHMGRRNPADRLHSRLLHRCCLLLMRAVCDTEAFSAKPAFDAVGEVPSGSTQCNAREHLRPQTSLGTV
jgi:hypothetical protein